MKYAILFAALVLSTPAFAETLLCRADFDESSHYELKAEEGRDVEFRYVTEDGMDLNAVLVPQVVDFVRGGKIQLHAENESMGATVLGNYDQTSDTYPATLTVNFDLEHADPVEMDATCQLQ